MILNGSKNFLVMNAGGFYAIKIYLSIFPHRAHKSIVSASFDYH